LVEHVEVDHGLAAPRGCGVLRNGKVLGTAGPPVGFDARLAGGIANPSWQLAPAAL